MVQEVAEAAGPEAGTGGTGESPSPEAQPQAPYPWREAAQRRKEKGGASSSNAWPKREKASGAGQGAVRKGKRKWSGI